VELGGLGDQTPADNGAELVEDAMWQRHRVVG